MLITKEHYEILEGAISKVVEMYPTTTKENYEKAHYSHKRYRWDLFWLCVDVKIFPRDFVFKGLYSYCNDTHIDTALKKITNTK